MTPQHGLDEATKAKLLLVLLAFTWGLSCGRRLRAAAAPASIEPGVR